MDLHDDLSGPVVLDTTGLPWISTPMAGVERWMLDRSGGEVARATSIVRYAPGSRFPCHSHGGGEEILVLDGVFRDEHGTYGPAAGCATRPAARTGPGRRRLGGTPGEGGQIARATRFSAGSCPAGGAGILPEDPGAGSRVAGVNSVAPRGAISPFVDYTGHLRQGDDGRDNRWVARLSAGAGPVSVPNSRLRQGRASRGAMAKACRCPIPAIVPSACWSGWAGPMT